MSMYMGWHYDQVSESAENAYMVYKNRECFLPVEMKYSSALKIYKSLVDNIKDSDVISVVKFYKKPNKNGGEIKMSTDKSLKGELINHLDWIL